MSVSLGTLFITTRVTMNTPSIQTQNSLTSTIADISDQILQFPDLDVPYGETYKPETEEYSMRTLRETLGTIRHRECKQLNYFDEHMKILQNQQVLIEVILFN